MTRRILAGMSSAAGAPPSNLTLYVGLIFGQLDTRAEDKDALVILTSGNGLATTLDGTRQIEYFWQDSRFMSYFAGTDGSEDPRLRNVLSISNSNNVLRLGRLSPGDYVMDFGLGLPIGAGTQLAVCDIRIGDGSGRSGVPTTPVYSATRPSGTITTPGQYWDAADGGTDTTYTSSQWFARPDGSGTPITVTEKGGLATGINFQLAPNSAQFTRVGYIRLWAAPDQPEPYP